MTVFTTLAGRQFDYLDPKNIDLRDVALGLSRAPRFAGQTGFMYSVAQHSLLVAKLCRFRLYALIHDAQEAFLCDLPTPAKEALRALGSEAYDELEDRMYRAICKAVNLPARWPVSVKLADTLAYRIEVAHFREGKPDPKLAQILSLPNGGKEAWLRAVNRERKK